MKIQFIEAAHPVDGMGWTAWVDAKGRFAMPSAGIASVASLIPADFEVAFVDERVGVAPRETDADLVAISTNTMYAAHAYRLADHFRAQGKPVVIGGTHPSLQPEQAAAHADFVVAGEAEGVWPSVLADLAGRSTRSSTRLPLHRDIYRAPAQQVPLDGLPQHAIELFDHERYMVHAVQTARGCSFGCEFCPTRAIFGNGYRLRALDMVKDNVERLIAIEDKPVFFTENVFGAGDLAFITELTSWLGQRGVRYGVICDWFVVTKQIVERLRDGGCGLVCVNLTGREEPKEIAALDAVREAGIPIWGYYMFGFEEDTPDVFERAVARAHEYDICCTTLTVLTPFPGTPMGKRLRQEGRVFEENLNLYDHAHVVFEPSRMSVDELQSGFDYVCDELSDRICFSNAAERVVR